MAEVLGTYYTKNCRTCSVTFYKTMTALDLVASRGGMVSVSHKRHRDGKYHSGGPWYMWKEHVSADRIYHDRNWYSYLDYKGNARIYDPNADTFGLDTAISLAGGDWRTSTPPSSVISSLEAKGSTAYNRLRPDKPSFDAALNLLELKDVPKTLKQTYEAALRTMDAYKLIKQTNGKWLYRHPTKRGKRIGEYTLMTLFGYLPLISSAFDFVEAFDNLDRDVARVIRNAQRPVRRRAVLKDEQSIDTYRANYSQTSSGSIVAPNLHIQLMPYGDHTKVSTVRVKEWCEGRFRMVLPKYPESGMPNVKLIRRRMLGSRVTLSTIYNLVPWSWLADYFTDLGQFVQAISPGVADNVYVDYFYVMRHIEHRVDEAFDGKFQTGSPFRVTKTTLRTLKMRRPATRFGFGVTQSMLSPKQLAILGALGLSKL